MLKILKCYRLDRKETYRCNYNEPVVFKSKISVSKMSKKRSTDSINFSYVSGNINNFFGLRLQYTLASYHSGSVAKTWDYNNITVILILGLWLGFGLGLWIIEGMT